MTERERIHRALEPLHASDDTLEEVLEMIDREKAVKHLKHTGRNTLRTVAVAAALVLALSVTAYAIGEYTGFFETVFGGEDAGHQTYDLPVDSWDDEGNQRTMEIVTEGEPVDQDMAQRVLDGAVATAGASVTVGDYTCTVEDVTMAENGVGVMTYTIESEKGFPDLLVTDETWGIFSLGGGMPLEAGDGASNLRDDPMVYPAGTDMNAGFGLDVAASLVSQTDTKLTVAAYMAMFQMGECPEALDVYFFWGDEGDFADEYKVTVPLADRAEAVDLKSEDGWTASVSPMGLALMEPADSTERETVLGDVIVHYADGTEYVVQKDEPYTVNHRVACGDVGIHRLVFNRLIDPETVESVTITRDEYVVQDADGQPVDMTGLDTLPDGCTEVKVPVETTFTK